MSARRKTDDGLRELLEVAKLADADGDEWDMDDAPEASLELAASCNPRAVIAIVNELLELRGTGPKMWLITVEMHEARINRRRTVIWKQTILTTETPDAYIGSRQKKVYFAGRDDECLTEVVLLFAMEVEVTTERLTTLDGADDVDIGSVRVTREWT